MGISLSSFEYDSVEYVSGPLLFVEGGDRFPAGSLVEITDKKGGVRLGQTLEVSRDKAVIQVLEGTSGLGTTGTTVRLESDIIKANVSRDMIGRVFDGLSRPIDGKPDVIAEARLPVAGFPINPISRSRPDEFIQTGISAIDCFNTLVRGQKLPVFSEAGLPSAELVISILNNSTVADDSKFLVIFAALGITRREQSIYQKNLVTGDRNLIAFLNLANDPVIERLLTPRFALTVAEYFAFELDYQVLVIMNDMTNYCTALREVSAAREEVPGRRGYPGYMYTDLSSLYERAGMLKGSEGSITQLLVLTVPDGDITHPIPDLTGYITEGQIVLANHLHKKGVFPPIDVLPSLSRLMNNGIGLGKTREDHRELANQLYACYAKGIDVRKLITIVGEDAISETDSLYLEFANRFEKELINQGGDAREINQTLDIGWDLLKDFPKEQLTRIDKDNLLRYYSVILEDGSISSI